jgi:hypothetical protein
LPAPDPYTQQIADGVQRIANHLDNDVIEGGPRAFASSEARIEREARERAERRANVATVAAFVSAVAAVAAAIK